MKRESKIHKELCNYIRMKYPHVIFFSDASGVRLTIGQAKAMKHLRSTKGIPDLFIAYPHRKYAGLFIEIKKEDATVYLKNGKLSQNKHIREQSGVLNLLEDVGYKADFGIGLEQCIYLVDNYMI